MRSDQLALRPITSTRRYLQVAMQLLEAIGSGAVAVGERLPSDRDLAERMGVSRMTAREAILALEVAGVLQVRTGDGTYVVQDGVSSSALNSAMSTSQFPAPASQVIEARLVVEPAAVALAAGRIDEDALVELEKLLDRTEALLDQPESLGTFVDCGLQFHAQLLRQCRNAHLATFAAALVSLEEHPLWTLLNAHAMQSVDARRAQVDEHREILAAVRAGRGDAASRLVTEHLTHLWTAVNGRDENSRTGDEPGSHGGV